MKLQNKYKIALIGYRLSGGGGDKVMTNLSCYLERCGVEVHLITVIDQEDEAVTYCGTVFSTQQQQKGKGIIGRVSRLWALRSYIKKEQFDVIIDFRFRTKKLQEFLMMRWVYSAPTWVTVHSSALDHYLPKSHWWAFQTYKKVKGIVGVSRYIQEAIQKQYTVAPVYHIYNSFDAKTISTALSHNLPFDFPFLMLAGQMENTVKQVDHLLEAYAQSSQQWQVVICGSGILQKNYEALAVKLGIEKRVHFVGYTPRLFAYFKAAQCTVLCSAFEGLSNVLIESLACGTPVVSYDCICGPNEIIDHQTNGLLVENQSIKALSQAIDRMMNDPEFLAHCAAHASKSVQKFELETVGAQWVELLNLK